MRRLQRVFAPAKIGGRVHDRKCCIKQQPCLSMSSAFAPVRPRFHAPRFAPRPPSGECCSLGRIGQVGTRVSAMHRCRRDRVGASATGWRPGSSNPGFTSDHRRGGRAARGSKSRAVSASVVVSLGQRSCRHRSAGSGHAGTRAKATEPGDHGNTVAGLTEVAHQTRPGAFKSSSRPPRSQPSRKTTSQGPGRAPAWPVHRGCFPHRPRRTSTFKSNGRRRAV